MCDLGSPNPLSEIYSVIRIPKVPLKELIQISWLLFLPQQHQKINFIAFMEIVLIVKHYQICLHISQLSHAKHYAKCN